MRGKKRIEMREKTTQTETEDPGTLEGCSRSRRNITQEELERTKRELSEVRAVLRSEREAHPREMQEVRSRLDEHRESRVDEFMRAVAREQRAHGELPSGSAAASAGPRGIVYVAPRFGTKFHVDRNCGGLRSATEVKEFQKCRLCG